MALLDGFGSELRVLAQAEVHEGGYFIAPTLVEVQNPKHEIMQSELFAPILALIRAADFADALRIANDSDYALTGAVYSRLPSHLELARREFRVGNLYLNRGCTGAYVNRQPFGGFGMSGTGPKAGGPGYLLQFADARVVTENTVRRGFAPEN
ncbi:MAG: aldehyde dehydrogenase family protein [Myxococcales bacterium]|nr:MAG: aldehyde dehydrogenase family protein [Myxococcales bacterium]